MIADGDLYVCAASGNVHMCGKKCDSKLHGGEGKDCDVCPITGRTFELDLAMGDDLWSGRYDLKRAADDAAGVKEQSIEQMLKLKTGVMSDESGTSIPSGNRPTTSLPDSAYTTAIITDDGDVSHPLPSGGVGMSETEKLEAERSRKIESLCGSVRSHLRLMMCSNERNEIEQKKHDLYLSKTAERIMKYVAKCTRERRAIKTFDVTDMMNDARVYQEEHKLFPVVGSPELTEVIEQLTDRIVHYWLVFTEDFKQVLAEKHYRLEHHVIAYAYARAAGVSRLIEKDEALKAYLPDRSEAHLYQPNKSISIRREHVSRASNTLNQLTTLYKSQLIAATSGVRL